MKIIDLERKRILGMKNICIVTLVLIFILLFLIYIILSDYKENNKQSLLQVYENIKEDRKSTKTDLLTIDKVRDIKDKYKKVYKSKKLTDDDGNERKDVLNSELKEDKYIFRTIVANYSPISEYDPSHILDISNQQTNDFYKIRLDKIEQLIEDESRSNNLEVPPKEKTRILEDVSKMQKPLKYGYAEGYEVAGSIIGPFTKIIIIIVGIIIAPLFSEDKQTKMNEIILSTKFGKNKLTFYRILTGLLATTIIYLTGVTIFSIITFSIFGIQGGNLHIQGGAGYWFSPYNITYLQQFIINIVIGYIACILMAFITMFITTFAKKVTHGVIFTIIFTILMVVMELQKIHYLNYYFLNFLPWNLINYFNMYKTYYSYNLFGVQIDKIIFQPVVALIIILVAFVGILCRKKKTRYL